MGRSKTSAERTLPASEVRICSCCGKEMVSGFVVDDGMEHYCSKKCLQKKYSWKKYEAMYSAGSAYWTQWV